MLKEPEVFFEGEWHRVVDIKQWKEDAEKWRDYEKWLGKTGENAGKLLSETIHNKLVVERLKKRIEECNKEIDSLQDKDTLYHGIVLRIYELESIRNTLQKILGEENAKNY